MSAIFAAAPVWVWPLLALLLTLGLNAMRSRSTPALPFYALPLLGLLSLRSVLSLEASGCFVPTSRLGC